MLDLFNVPLANIWESDDRIGMEIELAGCSPDDVILVVVQDRVTVRLERSLGPTGGPRLFHVAERVLGSLSRTFTLPAAVRADTAVLEFRHGLLIAVFERAPDGVQRRTILRPPAARRRARPEGMK